MNRSFPPLYAILSPDLLHTAHADQLEELAVILATSGVGIVQYRDKRASSRKLFDVSACISRALSEKSVRFIVNDRPDIARLAECGGVHVGQEDLPVDDARAVCSEAISQRADTSDKFWVGISTHTLQQVSEADTTSADYVAVGPIFATTTKERPDEIVGTDFIRQARQLTSKPLVAIGGITVARAEEVYCAGADCIAVARDLICAPNAADRASEYLAIAKRILT